MGPHFRIHVQSADVTPRLFTLLFTLLSALSLLLSLAVCLLWLRSYQTHHLLLRPTSTNYWHASSMRGQLRLFLHEPRRRLTGVSYTSHAMAAPSSFTQTSEELARAAYAREPAAPGMRLERYPAAPADQELQTAIDDWELHRRATAEAESSLHGIQSVLRARRITDDGVIRRAQRKYVDAMEAQMCAWARLQAAATESRGTSRLGFRWYAGDGPGGAMPAPFLAVPCWFIFLLTAALPATRLALRRRARKTSLTGLCPHCAYDLRATPHKCPECGAVPQSTP